ncbi:MAG: hypothetical protein IJB47_03280 [Oscillospiraceae bacterium]|nr:hypothetical protein [Oscillospiraceae bacterium]
MTKEEWNEGLNHLDPDLIEQYIEQKDHLRQKSRKAKGVWLRLGAIAACLLLIISAAIVALMLQDKPIILTGKQEIVYGEPWPGEIINASIMPPRFSLGTIVQAKVIEVLPDHYYVPTTDYRYLIARLSIVDVILGEGLPDEIYLRFPYYDADIFDGYDTFIFSIGQDGVENYMMINDATREVTFFPHMFTEGDLGYGDVIAFNDGKVDTGFFDKADHLVKAHRLKEHFRKMLEDPSAYSYPVGYDTTLEEAKANIRALIQERGIKNSDCRFLTTDDIFITDEQKQLMAYLEPSESNVFMQDIYRYQDQVEATYTRVVNGFLTDEVIILNGPRDIHGDIYYHGATYSKEDLANMPDLGEALANMDLSQLQPPNIEIEEDMQFVSSIATGIYRKVDDQAYGVVRVRWHYERIRPGRLNEWVRDECYYLYDQEGNGTMVERAYLQELFDDYHFEFRFPDVHGYFTVK